MASYLHLDHLSSVRLITNAAGQAEQATTYTPFGDPDTAQMILDSPFPATPEERSFIGERFDVSTGLLYLNARYMDPLLGRFMQPDWWEVRQAGVGTNRYAYANNDPVNLSDPTGNCWGLCTAAAIIGAWMSSSTPANAPGLNDDIVTQSSGRTLLNMTGGALGGRAAVGLFQAGFGTAASACAKNNTCRAATGAGAMAVEIDNIMSCADGPCAVGRVEVSTNKTTFVERSTGTQLRRSAEIDGQTIQINSGHAYNRRHSSGDVRDSGLSMDQIDNAIVDDITRNVDIANIARVPQSTDVTINIEGYSLTYRATMLPSGSISVSTYFPGR